MKKYLPIVLALLFLGVIGYIVYQKKSTLPQITIKKSTFSIGLFNKQRSCARPPKILKKLNITKPVIIDLSQKQYKGIALHYGKNLEQTIHPKQWEQYEHFSTYTVDKEGNIYLVPMPFISIHPTTFNLQKNIYKLDTQSGKISIFMHFDDVFPSASNPYGINAIAYDCDDNTLWVASIDESDYEKQRGIIYHLDIQTKKILQKVEALDSLSMSILRSETGKYLLIGSARDNGLYAYRIENDKLSNMPQKLLELPISNGHIRKIKVKNKNLLELQSIPFSYTLITQTAKKDRIIYRAELDKKGKWHLTFQP